MIPVYQTKFTTVDGDCMSACLASILECGLSDVPNFTKDRTEEINMWDLMAEWLGTINYAMVLVDPDTFMIIAKGREIFGVAGVPSQKLTGKQHSVVVRVFPKNKGSVIEIVHDPNPNNEPSYRGKDIIDISFLIPLNPTGGNQDEK